MAEHVTQFSAVKGEDDSRLRGLMDRFPGGEREARGVTAREADALFEKLAAAKDRYPLSRVTRHVCRHDEGVPICTPDREV